MSRSAVLFWIVLSACVVAWYAAESHAKSDADAIRRSAPFYRVRTDRRVVALTFDDGPDPVYTPQVLDFLARERIHATFFDLGRSAEASPEIVRRQIREGHAVGNHTYSHRQLTKLNPLQIKEEVERGERAIKNASGLQPVLLRPPYGKWNHDVQDVAAANGCEIVLWSVCLERSSLKTPRELADRVVGLVEPGVIVLIHDGGDRPDSVKSRSLAAVKILVAELKKRGYQFVTVPELLRLAGQDGSAQSGNRRPHGSKSKGWAEGASERDKR